MKKITGSHSNLTGALAGSLLGAVSSLIPAGACFGDANCQANRAAQAATEQTQAQAQLIAAQNAQKATQSQITVTLIISGVLLLIAAVGGFVYLKSKNKV